WYEHLTPAALSVFPPPGSRFLPSPLLPFKVPSPLPSPRDPHVTRLDGLPVDKPGRDSHRRVFARKVKASVRFDFGYKSRKFVSTHANLLLTDAVSTGVFYFDSVLTQRSRYRDNPVGRQDTESMRFEFAFKQGLAGLVFDRQIGLVRCARPV